jgi:hypothetical protein
MFKNSLLAFVSLVLLSACTSPEVESLPSEEEVLIENENIINDEEEVVEDDLSNRKVYRNEELGFELSYPREWKIDNARSKINEIVFDTGLPSRESIKFDSNADDLTFQKLKNLKIKEYKTVTEEIEGILIDNTEAIKLSTTEFGIDRIFFIKNNFIYEITTGGRMPVDYLVFK